MVKLINAIEKIGEKWWGMMLLISIPLFVALSPVLIGGYDFIVAESERFSQGFDVYKKAILNKDSIFWNPYLLSGFPSFASMTGGFFNPVMYVGLNFFSVSFVYNWVNFLYLALAGLFTSQLLKKINVSFWGSFIGGVIFSFSRWPKNYDLTINSTLFLLPLLFILLLRIRDNKICYKYCANIFIGSAAIAITWFSAFWHFLVEILFIVAIFSLYVPFVDFYKDKNETGEKVFSLLKCRFRKYIKVPLSFLIMNIVGTSMALIQLVPTAVLISLSSRAEQINQLKAWGDGFQPQDIIGLILPYFNYPLRALSTKYVDYWGVLALFLIILAFSLKLPRNFFKKDESQRNVVFFSLLFLIGLILSINNSPLFWFIHHLPIINLLHEASRWMIITSFAAAVLAGLGVNILLRDFELLRKSVKTKIILKIFKWLSIFLFAASVVSVLVEFLKDKILFLLNAYFMEFIYSSTTNLPLEFYHNYIASLFGELVYSFSPFNPRFILPLFFLFAGYFIIRFYVSGKFANPKNFAFILSAAIIINFVLVFYFNNNIGQKKILHKQPETVKFLSGQEEGRVFSFFRFTALQKMGDYSSESQERSVLKSELLFPNKNVLYGVESIDYEGDPITNTSMSRLVEYVDGAVSSFTNIQGFGNLELPPEEKFKIFISRKPILDFLGVRYLISSYDMEVKDKNILKIFETKVTSKKIPVYIYKNISARSLYYFTDEEWLLNISSDRELEDLIIKLRETKGIVTQEGIKLIKRSNAALNLKTSAKETKLLVFSQNNLPGWLAKVDNKDVPIYRIGDVYMGIVVPPGQHEVLFEYSYKEIWRYFFDLF